MRGSTAALQWVVTAYTLALGRLLLGGRVADDIADRAARSHEPDSVTPEVLRIRRSWAPRTSSLSRLTGATDQFQLATHTGESPFGTLACWPMRVSRGSGTLAAHMAESTLSRRAFVGISLGALAELALGCGGTHRVPPRARLDAFIELSRVVTGADSLPTDHARTYMAALEKAPLKLSPSALVDLAGYARGEGPASLDALRRSRAFSAPGAEACAQAIAAAWWSGTVPEHGGGQRVVTYTDALVWQAVPWAHPQTECLGATGAWARPGRSSA